MTSSGTGTKLAPAKGSFYDLEFALWLQANFDAIVGCLPEWHTAYEAKANALAERQRLQAERDHRDREFERHYKVWRSHATGCNCESCLYYHAHKEEYGL